ncbi:MAG: formylglycine-generating enzyme family protein [Chitinophagales bacterium]|nr:formylglycine-generating enzyme family protein [Chitinophagales bacterium]
MAIKEAKNNRGKFQMTKPFFIFIFSLFVFKISAQTKLVVIEGGIYRPLYSLDTQRIVVKKFSLDNFQVSNAEFLTFVKKNAEWKKSKAKKIFIDQGYLGQWTTDTSFSDSLANQPVVNVSWFAATKYCECQGKRLATTAEWELAAQANETNKDGYKDKRFNQWLLDWVAKPQPINRRKRGSTFKNVYGVYDMHGLVWEWTSDFNSALTTGESRENGGLDKSKFCGGGSFSSKDVRNYAAFMRYAMRSSLKAKYCVANLGFRCAK